MGNAFYRQNEANLFPAMLSSILEVLGKPSGNPLSTLTSVLEHMDPELIEKLAHQFSVTIPGRSE